MLEYNFLSSSPFIDNNFDEEQVRLCLKNNSFLDINSSHLCNLTSDLQFSKSKQIKEDGDFHNLKINSEKLKPKQVALKHQKRQNDNMYSYNNKSNFINNNDKSASKKFKQSVFVKPLMPLRTFTFKNGQKFTTNEESDIGNNNLYLIKNQQYI